MRKRAQIIWYVCMARLIAALFIVSATSRYLLDLVEGLLKRRAFVDPEISPARLFSHRFWSEVLANSHYCIVSPYRVDLLEHLHEPSLPPHCYWMHEEPKAISCFHEDEALEIVLRYDGTIRRIRFWKDIMGEYKQARRI